MIGANVDLADCIEADRRQALLAAEVQHRVGNTLSVVQCLAHMSFAALPREAVAPFERRLITLGELHRLLAQTGWDGADLQQVLERVSDTFRVRGRIDICGAAVGANPTAAVFYGLAFHELFDNAIKHGALSNSDGRLSVSLRLVEPDRSKFHFIWREQGGPPVTAPSREGFGSRMLKRALAAQLGTSVNIHYLADGLVCEFEGPVHRHPSPWLDLDLAYRS